MEEYLPNLDCPQYICFENEIDRSNDSLGDIPHSSSNYSLVEEDPSLNMDVDDNGNENADCTGDDQIPGSMQTSLSESYFTDSGCDESAWPASVKSALKSEDFPVVCPKGSSLPGQAPKKNTKANKTTKPVPFHLTEVKKRKREDEFVPLAAQVAAFQNKTPQRFHNNAKDFQPMEHWSPKRVIPKSPNLQAAKRSRKVNVISQEEKEKMEIEEMKRYKFRARPINQSVLYRPQNGKKIGRKTATKPHEPHLHTAERAAENYGRPKEEEKPFEFHARPVPKAILSGPTGLKEKPVLPVTEAKTPNFALKTRAQKWQQERKMNETVVETQTFKAVPAPVSHSQPFVVKHEKKRTEIQPFSFEERDKQRMKQKEKKIQEEIEKENAVYVFKAQPMPSPSPAMLPNVPKKPVTQVQPFNLHLHHTSTSRHSSFNSSMDQLCPTFKANPPTVLKKPPFVPEKPPKPVVEVKEFQLQTVVRASERQKLKEINEIKEHEKELALQRIKARQEEEERKEIMRLRQEIVHKANPIRHYKPVEIKPSSKPPTEPISPKFKTDERLQLKH